MEGQGHLSCTRLGGAEKSVLADTSECVVGKHNRICKWEMRACVVGLSVRVAFGLRCPPALRRALPRDAMGMGQESECASRGLVECTYSQASDQSQTVERDPYDNRWYAERRSAEIGTDNGGRRPWAWVV